MKSPCTSTSEIHASAAFEKRDDDDDTGCSGIVGREKIASQTCIATAIAWWRLFSAVARGSSWQQQQQQRLFVGIRPWHARNSNPLK